MPHVTIDVYGSHATQLCLHWSDIDLVVCPSRNADQSRSYGQGSGQNNVFNGRHLQLEQVYEELRRDEHRHWISKVQFIENTTVPVIKLQCSLYPANGQKAQFGLNDPAKLKYPEITMRAINIDIT